jgi:hypothetical protein
VGRFIQQDPAGDGMNWYAYAGNNPVAWVDPEGLAYDWLDAATDASTGFADTITFGLTALGRRWMGTDCVVHRGSGAYKGGQAAGLAWDIAMGVAGGIEAAGAKGPGMEFSHFVPKRWGGPRSIWNGNYVPREVHALSDPWRYRFMPRPWKAGNPAWGPLRAGWARLPNAWKGTGAGIGYGVGGIRANGY